jgi:hypothetical protein
VSAADKESVNRAMAGKRWGDAAVIGVRRGQEELTLTAVFRRTLKKGKETGSER